MNKVPLISICIPAYKRLDFLKRLLDSILIQTFKDFEVVITDDSPGTDVENFCKNYDAFFSIKYKKNSVALGTPENWNEAIRLATGKWIKLMHDDDWFASPDSLNVFQDTISNVNSSFIFSAYCNHYFQTGKKEDVHLNAFRKYLLNDNPATLFSSNVIGPPSVTLHKNECRFFYDNKTKWVVDINFYMQYLKDNKPVYIDKVLVDVGIGKEQVTQDCFRKREVEIPENFYLLNKVGAQCLRNIFVYDAWWRLLRNLEIQNANDIFRAGYAGRIPVAIASMIGWQRRIPGLLLKVGIISKAFMIINYIFNYNEISS